MRARHRESIPRLAALAFQGFGNAGDEAILVGLEHLLADAADIQVVFGGSRAPIAGFPRAARRAPFRLLPTPSALRSLRRMDALLIAGGGFMNDHFPLVIPRYLAWVLAARLVGRPVIWVGAGVGPIRRRAWRWMAGAAFRASDIVLVRDEASGAWVRRCAPSAHVAVGVDPAIFLELSHDGSTQTRQGTVIVGRLPLGDDDDRDRHVVDALLATAQEAKLPAPVTFLVMDPPEDARFEVVLRRRAEELGLPRPIIRKASHDPADTLASLAEAELVVSMRLHGVVLAAVASTPVVPVSYDEKVSSAAARLGLGAATIEVDDLSPGLVTAAAAAVRGAGVVSSVRQHIGAMRREAPAMRSAILEAIESVSSRT